MLVISCGHSTWIEFVRLKRYHNLIHILLINELMVGFTNYVSCIGFRYCFNLQIINDSLLRGRVN